MQNKNNLLNHWTFSPQILAGGIFKRYRGRTTEGNRLLPGPFRYYSLYAIRSGNASVTLNGKREHFEAPVAFLFQPGQPYEVQIPRISDCSWLDFGVIRKELQDVKTGSIYKQMETQPAALETFGRELPLRVPDELFSETFRTCLMASGEYWMPSLPHFRAHVQLSSWLLLYLETLELDSKRKPKKNSDRMERIFAVAERHYLQGITAETWAERVGLSKRRLDELCKNERNQTAREYLNQIRFQHAQRLLRERKRSIAAIGERCGYPSATSFTRWFKQQSGLTPSVWRERHL